MHRAAVAVAPAYRGRMLNTRAQWSAEFETGAGTHVKNSNGEMSFQGSARRQKRGITAVQIASGLLALRIARGQEATLLQARAGIALARHFAESGRREEAQMALVESGVSALTDRTVPEIVAADSLSAALG